MPVISLGSEWVELDITNGWLQNRGPGAIECVEAVSPEQVSYGLISAGQAISHADWLPGTIFVRKSQTSSGAKAVVVCNANATNELAEIQSWFAQGAQGGIWSASLGNYFEDAAATIPATLNGVVGAMASADGAIIAVQATTGNKPFLRRTPDTGIYWLDSNTASGALVATFGSSLGSACTVVRAGLTGVTFEENVTIGTTYNIAPPYGFNSEVLVINRALTAAEKALLTQYMARSVPALGPELIPDPGFANPALWSIAPSAWSIVDGVAVASGVFGSLQFFGILVSGKSYLRGLSVVSRTAGSVTLPYAGDPATISYAPITPGAYSSVMTSNNTKIVIYSNSFVGSIDNATVREIL